MGVVPRPSSTAVDVGVAAVFLLIVAVEVTSRPSAGVGLELSALLTLVMAGCLALRRSAPLTALVVATTALVAESLLQVATEFSPLATLVCAYSVGLYAPPARARWGALVVVAGVLGFFAAAPAPQRPGPADLVPVLTVWLVAWGLGYTTARRRDVEVRAERALERQVIAEERVRVSRELHDVVGHTVNLLVVQAGAARLTLDTDPATTRTLLEGMEATGRATLADLDRVLAGLRSDGRRQGEDAVAPAPGLSQLPELVGRFQDSGVDVQLSVDPSLRLPRDLDLSAYRIVQEALTNTLKHAAPCAATVVVQRHDGSLVVDVTDTGPGAGSTDRHGRGLLGISERVAMAGGVLEHGDGELGGFRLRAVLPAP